MISELENRPIENIHIEASRKKPRANGMWCGEKNLT